MNSVSRSPVPEGLLQAIDAARPFFEKLPGVVLVHSIHDGSVLYMNQKGLSQLEVTLEEVQAMGTDYYERFFNPEQAREYVPEMLAMVARNDPSETFTFYQQVRFPGIAEWQWHLSAVRIFYRDENDQPVAVVTTAQHLSSEHHYTRKVTRLLEELTFLKDHHNTFEQLSVREREILRLLAQGYSTPEIADMLSISVFTADTHRRNIRRKLGVHRSSHLQQFARAFDLI